LPSPRRARAASCNTGSDPGRRAGPAQDLRTPEQRPGLVDLLRWCGRHPLSGAGRQRL